MEYASVLGYLKWSGIRLVPLEPSGLSVIVGVCGFDKFQACLPNRPSCRPDQPF